MSKSIKPTIACTADTPDAAASTAVALAADSFGRLPLTAAMLENLARIGYERMTPIQAASLPIALAGHDLIAQAKTGRLAA